jgi:hypothetical protein
MLLELIFFEITSIFLIDSKISDSSIGMMGFKTLNIEYRKDVKDALGE